MAMLLRRGGTRQRATAAAVALAAAALITGALAARGGQAAPQATRPNVIVLMTDDQDSRSLAVMTRVQRLLGDEGVTFDSSFVSFSLCCPSRATFLTGQYAHNHGVLGNEPPQGGYTKLDNSNTLPVWLRRAGYHTGLVGKYLTGYGYLNPATEVPPGWEEWHGTVDPSTTSYFGYTLNENGSLRSYNFEPANYQTDVEGQKAVDLVRRFAPSADPYFLWIAFLAPHAGTPIEARDPREFGTPTPAPRHQSVLASQPLPRPESFNEADMSDKPLVIRGLPPLDEAKIAAIQANYQQRLEALLAVDEAVARIVEAVRESGELENTYIVFTSDNGYLHGEHRVPNGKVLLYEPSIRVPLLMRGPGIPRGVHRRQLVSNVDLAPTILELTGASPGVTVDGRSLVPIFRDGGLEWGRDLAFERGPEREPPGAQFSALRTPRYMYAEYANGDRELYDLVRDPEELQSRHGDPTFASLMAELSGRLASLRGCAGDACRRGPALTLVTASPGACVRGRLAVRLRGPDASRLERVDVSVGGRRVASATSPPFAVRLGAQALPRRQALLRVRAQLLDGRALTLDRTLRRCR